MIFVVLMKWFSTKNRNQNKIDMCFTVSILREGKLISAEEYYASYLR